MPWHCSSYPRLAARLALLVAALLLLPVAVAAAQECGASPQAADGVERAVAGGRLAEAEASLLLSVLEEACRKGLALEPFEDKLLEGLAKQVPPQSILRVLRRKYEQYCQAADLLREQGVEPAPAVVRAMGEGLAEGVDAGAFRTYVAAYHGQDAGQFLVGLEMFSLLSRSGFDQGLSRQVLDAGFAAQTLTPQWRYFVQVVLVARQRGIADGETAAAAAGVLASGGGPGDVPARLGFTHRDLSGGRSRQ